MKHDFKVYLRLLSYLKPYWGVAILVVVGFAINAATEVSVAKLLEKLLKRFNTVIKVLRHCSQFWLLW